MEPAEEIFNTYSHLETNGIRNLVSRPRRTRISPILRRMVRETILQPDDFIYPLFITHGREIRNPISSMPGIHQLSTDLLKDKIKFIARQGIPAVLLFGIPEKKDPVGLENFSKNGIVQQAVRVIKETVPEMVVITDVCLCEYTNHGHCGLLNTPDSEYYNRHLPEGYVMNDPTLELLAKVSISHAEAGADIIAPSGMMDGMVRSIRSALDETGFEHLPILSYSTKYASAFYGPFREASQGAPKFGDRKSHQMDPGNVREALRETAIDIAEGADMIMVKPALPYLDVIRTVRDHFPQIPLAAYNVSGEYSMVKAASQNGWMDEQQVVLELLTGIKRAGAGLIITYHAIDAARWLNA